MANYSPFTKPFEKITSEDLSVLREVREGWYVEYKQEAPSTKSIAKSISAFANTYGGWLFLGIKEKSKDEPVAGEFLGIDHGNVDIALQSLRQGVASYVTPIPHFEVKTCAGPCTSIGLENGKSIICIYVPQSHRTPHVHNSGQIFRRIADSSEPKPENDRFILDGLWQRGEKLEKKYAQWIDEDPELSKGEEDQPYLRIMIVADLMEDRGLRLKTSIKQLHEIMKPKEKGVPLPFDTIYTTPNGFMARQLKDNNANQLGLVWHIEHNLRNEIILPLTTHKINKPEHIEPHLAGYSYPREFKDIISSYKFDSLRIIDLNFVFNVLNGVFIILEKIAQGIDWDGNLYLKIKLLNGWRTIPFIDTKSAIVQFKQYGLPMCMNGDILCPSGSKPETFYKISSLENAEGSSQAAFRAFSAFLAIERMMGLPTLSLMEEQDTSTYIKELLEAGNRARENQTIRNSSVD